MEWEKMAPWDLGELDQSIDPDMGSVVVSSGGPERQIARLDCSVDLKLGGLGDFGSAEKWREQPPRLSTMLPSYTSSKRARAQSNGGQSASCLVEGCGSDLSGCRDYHRRHKVCEVHSKTPVVVVGGQEQRFCQQCSRFHLLVEFDGVKKSCRKRLEGHNKRRRKPRHESPNSANLFPNHQGSRFSAYPPMFSSAPIEPNWGGILKTEDDGLYPTHAPPMHLFARQHQFPDSSDRSYNEGKQFPFLQDSDIALGSRMTLETSVCQPLRNTISPVESSNNRMFSGGLTQVLDSDCALSLLSSPTPTSGIINMAQMVPADRIPMGQPLVSSLQLSGLGRYSHSQASNDVSRTGFSCSGIDDERVGTVLVSDDASDADIHYQGMFHVAGEGSSDGASHALPFSWQ